MSKILLLTQYYYGEEMRRMSWMGHVVHMQENLKLTAWKTQA